MANYLQRLVARAVGTPAGAPPLRPPAGLPTPALDAPTDFIEVVLPPKPAAEPALAPAPPSSESRPSPQAAPEALAMPEPPRSPRQAQPRRNSDRATPAPESVALPVTEERRVTPPVTLRAEAPTQPRPPLHQPEEPSEEIVLQPRRPRVSPAPPPPIESEQFNAAISRRAPVAPDQAAVPEAPPAPQRTRALASPPLSIPSRAPQETRPLPLADAKTAAASQTHPGQLGPPPAGKEMPRSVQPAPPRAREAPPPRGPALHIGRISVEVAAPPARPAPRPAASAAPRGSLSGSPLLSQRFGLGQV